MRIFIIILAAIILAGCGSNYPELQTVSYVDINKYLGKWYEIASFPNSFQKGCNCTSAEYSIEDDFIRVVNTCRDGSATGEIRRVRGRAFVVDNSGNSKLKVQFFWPFRGDYYIIDLAEDYSWAVVGTPGRNYLWILSRTPIMEEKLYKEIISKLPDKGFDITKLQKTNQNCEQ